MKLLMEPLCVQWRSGLALVEQEHVPRAQLACFTWRGFALLLLLLLLLLLVLVVVVEEEEEEEKKKEEN